MPTIYIDCSETSQSPLNTGIQRVVRNIAHYAPELAARKGCAVKLVAFRDGEYSDISLSDFRTPRFGTRWQERLARDIRLSGLSWIDKLRECLASISNAPAWKEFVNAPRYRFGLARCVLYPFHPFLLLFGHNAMEAEAKPLPPWAASADPKNDILLLADSTWNFIDIWPAARRFKEQGGHVATIIYDLIPMSHPQFCVPSLVSAFSSWIHDSIPCVDFYICISRSTEDTLRAFLQEAPGSGQTGHFHLGSDLELTKMEDKPKPKVVDIVSPGGPIFLAVGSLEPRKNLTFVLDAFERAWQQSSDIKLVLVGHNTWRVDALLDRIHQHPRLNTSLFWLRDANDADLEYLYGNATALVFASVIEGFGLPVVEAMQRGLPVVCSDIPVLREIADGKATFFSLDEQEELVRAIFATIAEHTHPERTPQPWLSWRDSTDILLQKICTQLLPAYGDKYAAEDCGSNSNQITAGTNARCA